MLKVVLPWQSRNACADTVYFRRTCSSVATNSGHSIARTSIVWFIGDVSGIGGVWDDSSPTACWEALHNCIAIGSNTDTTPKGMRQLIDVFLQDSGYYLC